MLENTNPIDIFVLMQNTQSLYRLTFGLAIFTIVYNLAEGIVATWFGAEDESLTLFGFGLDSFIEVVSGFAVAQMVIRIWHRPTEDPKGFEHTSLRITGISFYVLAAGLLITAIFAIIQGHKPDSSFWGLLISLISLTFMGILIWLKLYAGKRLKNQAIIADARCAMVCMWMSGVLLASSGIYWLTGFERTDAIGAIVLAFFAFREGRESIEKANNKSCACSCHCDK